MDTNWNKSSFSGNANPNCVECRADHGRVHLRDTQHRELGALAFPTHEWRAFLAALRCDDAWNPSQA